MRGKLFQQIASAALSAALVITGMPSAFAADAAETNKLDASYDMSTDTLSVDVDLTTVGKKMVSVIIAPADIANYQPATLAANDSVILKTVQTDVDGVANFQIVAPTGFTGRYTVKINAGSISKVVAIADVSDADASGLYTQISGGNYTATGSAVVNPVTDEKDAAAIASYIEKNIATVTDAQSALDVYMSAEAIAYVMSNKLTLSEALEAYTANIGTYTDGSETKLYKDDYAALDSDVQAKMEEWFEKNGT
ncbi:MAG: hypothetical protein IJ365_00400, partial [Clostridia bacterium]|nr:hypothetical protein [Clostridia bacterium]